MLSVVEHSAAETWNKKACWFVDTNQVGRKSVDCRAVDVQ